MQGYDPRWPPPDLSRDGSAWARSHSRARYIPTRSCITASCSWTGERIEGGQPLEDATD
jgi:hypothetical protein